MQLVADDESGPSKSKRRTSGGVSKNGGVSTRSLKRRRASSPGPRKSAPKRPPSAGDSQLDADGETDPDAVEVEDELMQVSPEDGEGDTARSRYPATASGILNRSKAITFDDLEHFYSGNPIDIDQNTDEQVVQKPEAQPRPQSPRPAASPPPDDVAPESQAPASPVAGAYDPLFDSPPSHSFDKPPEIPILPHHRARAAKPLVKLIDTTTLENASKQSRITAKARLMSLHTTETPSPGGPSSNVAKRGGKPGPGQSSSGLITKNRSSLLTVSKGALKSVKGKFVSTIELDQHDEIEEDPIVRGTSLGDKLLVASWSDEDVIADQDHQMTSDPQPARPPSGDELAGLKADLPDYEDDSATQPLKIDMPASDITLAPANEEPPNQPSVKVAEELKESDHVADTSPPVSEARQQASTSNNPVAPPVDEAVKKR